MVKGVEPEAKWEEGDLKMCMHAVMEDGRLVMRSQEQSSTVETCTSIIGYNSYHLCGSH